MAEGGGTFLNKRKYVLRGTAKYECGCGHKWKVRHSEGRPKSCESPRCDHKDIQPYDFEPDPWTKGPTEWRLFGEFQCPCRRTWPSAYTWIEWERESHTWIRKRQECKDLNCNNIEVGPKRIRPLLHSGSHSRKQHLTEYCEKCKELGKDCRYYTPQAKEYDDDVEEDSADDTSVTSDCSSVDELEYDDNRLTPVPSDEDTTEDRLSSHLKNL